MDGEDQMKFLKAEYNSVSDSSSDERGRKAAAMRGLRDYMDLDSLFNQDEDFMNIELRDFLNLKEDGTINYQLSDMTKENGWKKLGAIASQYHQTTAGEDLNIKYVNKDGREAVFTSSGVLITEYPDKGTFNYYDGTATSSILFGIHKLYDMNPYNDLMDSMKIKPKKRVFK